MDFECPDLIDFEVDGEDPDTDLKMRIVGYASNPLMTTTSSASSGGGTGGRGGVAVDARRGITACPESDTRNSPRGTTMPGIA